MPIHDMDYVHGSDAAVELVDAFLGIIFRDVDDYAPPSRERDQKVKHFAATDKYVRHALEYYDDVFLWWTRCRAADVEANLQELVERAGDPDPWFADTTGAKAEDGEIVCGNGYVVLALLCLATGARVPRPLAAAFEAAADRDVQRCLDLGAPERSLAVQHRRDLAGRLKAHDWSAGRRLLVREAFGPRELGITAQIANRKLAFRQKDVVPWFPKCDDPAPRVVADGLLGDSLSPWAGASTLFQLMQHGAGEPPPPYFDYHPPARPKLPPPADLHSILDFGLPPPEAEPPAPRARPPPPEAPAEAAAAPRADSDSDGGFDDLHALHKRHRNRDKHSHSHAASSARQMAISKRAGQRARSSGGGG